MRLKITSIYLIFKYMLHHLDKSYIYSILVSLLVCAIFYALNRNNNEQNKVTFKTIATLFLTTFIVTIGGFYFLRSRFQTNIPSVNTSLPNVPIEQTIMTGNPKF